MHCVSCCSCDFQSGEIQLCVHVQALIKQNLRMVTFQYEKQVKSTPDQEETSNFFKLHF